jgi:outer membrane protein assembly factor BamA
VLRSVLALFAALVVLTVYVAARPRVRDAESDPVRATRMQEVQSVAFDGRGLPVAALRELLATRSGELVDTAKLAHDRDVLEDALVARGYFDAKVSDAQLTFDAAGAAFVTFAIEQGPLFHVRSVIVTGASDLDAGIVTLSTGEVALAERVARVRDAIAERLAARGKRAHVVANVRPDPTSASVDIELVATR